MDHTLPIALVQHAALPAGDFETFAASLRKLVQRHPETELWVFPELHLTTPDEGQLPESAAECLGGARDQALGSLAAELGIWLVPGSVYEDDGEGQVFNTALVYSPAGERVAAYRKIFPWRPAETTTPGSEFVVFDIPGAGRVGLSICYDSWFPELTRHLAWMGAELVLCLVQTATSDREQELVLTRANAIVNQCWVASVNGAAPTASGRSLLVDPEGRVRVASAAADAEVLTDVVDFNAVRTTRRYGTASVTRPWSQMRPDDQPIRLPLYDGAIDPARWKPAEPEPPGKPSSTRDLRP
ncbi:carbon-nitrogen hydrolase family protein [Saxibacter everestensis]|uniref:Carbon-nitrogen hydrolase family protein n=1 Tax=Saxibacter everestensis TaxID=2909229 RepID=A0ABY8QUJ6_9MICO|nr:carbon-nitrogen hydrolase family protein [Brevibacteriaceae bacterium ZFBP1038]